MTREQLVENDACALTPGDYYIATKGSITITNEGPLFHQISLQTATHVSAFTDAVRNRDQRCVITGRPAVINGVTFWEPFEAAHVFPRKYGGYWRGHNFGRWITIPPASESHGTINSVQNGILFTRDMHPLFDSYQISINPKEQHMIVCFTPVACSYGIAGAHLDQRFLENPLRPPDPLLFWHFRQAVLANMKGAGETCFEMGFPSSPDTAGQIMGD
ncbi:hypothetical protein HOY80DRAFT_1020080 [Tuber brumale]|nr:hypothetical protein HOY80DRAFT_1020080 [Tuber brumale]